MPCVCALGRGQVDGQCSALPEREAPELCSSCNNFAARAPHLCSLALAVTYLFVCDYLRRNSWMKGDPLPLLLCVPRAAATIVVRSLCARDADIVSGIIFRETSFDCLALRAGSIRRALRRGFLLLHDFSQTRRGALRKRRQKWILLLVNQRVDSIAYTPQSFTAAGFLTIAEKDL